MFGQARHSGRPVRIASEGIFRGAEMDALVASGAPGRTQGLGARSGR
jgi:hypothetical protein